MELLSVHRVAFCLAGIKVRTQLSEQCQILDVAAVSVGAHEGQAVPLLVCTTCNKTAVLT